MEREDMIYKTTKDECIKRIGNNVCEECGEKCEPIETVDNSKNPTFWVGCKKCEKFRNSVPKDVYLAAKELEDLLPILTVGGLCRLIQSFFSTKP